ncbi:MAG: serine hydrolase [Fibrella sp.]|nr:serine hydrolase [Armatimonadota bacterium]
MRRLVLCTVVLLTAAVLMTGFLRRSLSRSHKAAFVAETTAETAAGETFRSAAYARAADYSAAHGGMSVLVLKDGVPVYERYEGDYSASKSHQLASGTKSFWGVLAACAVQDGILKSLDEPAADTITEWKSDPQRSQITVRHLLSFTSGLKPAERLFARPDVKDRYAFAINQPAIAKPGTKYQYDDVHLYAFGGLLTRKLAAKAKREGRSPEDVLAYLDRRVLKPIGLRYDRWARDAAGNPALPYGAVLSAREWAKFGELIRLDGKWKGE